MYENSMRGVTPSNNLWVGNNYSSGYSQMSRSNYPAGIDNTSTFIQTCCCGAPDTLLLTNTGTTTINIGANPIFKVKKIN